MASILEKLNSPEDIKKMSVEEIEILGKDIRKFLIHKVSKTGGHLGSNLGIVELTMAIHKVFDTSKDRLVFDVGHQSYVHKIITGRKDKFDSLRQYQGLSGFPKRKESIHDSFDTGHSSTSISGALGMALARDLKGENFNVIAVIGDGALTGGPALEGLNNMGSSNTNILVILNDNEMSISKNVGSIPNYLNKLRLTELYRKFSKDFKDVVSAIPKIGDAAYKTAGRIKDSVKNMVIPGGLFESMGIKYYGPVDGHDFEALVEVLNKVKNVEGPKILHVVTKKGRGYRLAEENPADYHGVSPFDITKGVQKSSKITYSTVVGQKLSEMAAKNSKVVAITAAMPTGTGLDIFQKAHKDRYFDVGIAEGHGVTLAAGMATQGLKPYFAVYSTFLQRGFDQILHDVAIQNLPVTFLIDRAGLVGDDGETHHGVFDISYLSMIPNMTIMAPKGKKELEEMMELSLKIDGPCAIRYPRGEAALFEEIEKTTPIDQVEILTEGRDCCIIAVGNMVKTGLKVSEILKEKGISCEVINPRILKPINEELVIRLKSRHSIIITLEDNVVIGGFGRTLESKLRSNGYAGVFEALGIPDSFVEQGKVDKLYEICKLSPIEVSKLILEKHMAGRY